MYIVVYRPHNAMICETQYIGPFATHDVAYDVLCAMPALGLRTFPENHATPNSGVKFIQELATHYQRTCR